MKNSFPFLALMFFSFNNAQVYINVPNEADRETSASFQIEPANSHKGVTIPAIALTSKTNYTPIVVEPKTGLLVYNTTKNENIDVGYYYWDTNATPHWEKIGGIAEKFTILQNIDKNVLGYNPTGVGSSSPATITVSGSNATKTVCKKWELSDNGNGHTYCAYTLTNGKTFSDVYNAAKAAGGYMVTLTSAGEWNFVKSNIIDASSLNNPIWIGYTALKTPGNSYAYRWITNETWRNNWGNAATSQSFFAANNPVAAASGLCSIISGKTYDADRKWYGTTCNSTAFQSASINTIIIEFNQ